jgi:mRNA-degrading endonuclease toxin of MazEF toxin-antitoxin module
MTDSILRRGYLYWAILDKRRPALVVSPGYRNARASDVIVVPCSTTLRDAPTHVRLSRREAGAPRACVLKCEQITTLHRDDVDARMLGSPVSPARMAEVERAILRAIGIAIGY